MAYETSCTYCGETVSRSKRDGGRLVYDHVTPKHRGGTDADANMVPACSTCNGIKGIKTVTEARPLLVQKMLGWPKFNAAQLAWLRAQGFDMAPFDTAQLHPLGVLGGMAIAVKRRPRTDRL